MFLKELGRISVTFNISESRSLMCLNCMRFLGWYYKTLLLSVSAVSEGQKRGEADFNERFFRFVAQKKGKSTTADIKLQRDMPLTHTKTLSYTCSWARKFLIIRPLRVFCPDAFKLNSSVSVNPVLQSPVK